LIGIRTAERDSECIVEKSGNNKEQPEHVSLA
jgi:hypothetical protein